MMVDIAGRLGMLGHLREGKGVYYDWRTGIRLHWAVYRGQLRIETFTR